MFGIPFKRGHQLSPMFSSLPNIYLALGQRRTSVVGCSPCCPALDTRHAHAHRVLLGAGSRAPVRSKPHR
eukprot:4028299-Alexandrium_andersonii.AAC.1